MDFEASRLLQEVARLETRVTGLERGLDAMNSIAKAGGIPFWDGRSVIDLQGITSDADHDCGC
jgi:hypothetical protein